MGDGDSGLSRLRVGPTSLEGCYGPLRERCLGDWHQGMRGLKILDLKGMFLRAWGACSSLERGVLPATPHSSSSVPCCRPCKALRSEDPAGRGWRTGVLSRAVFSWRAPATKAGYLHMLLPMCKAAP